MGKGWLALVALVSGYAMGYDVTVSWTAPEYDVAGAPATAPLIYQVYGRYAGEGYFQPIGDPTDQTESTADYPSNRCFEVYVTAKFVDSAESDPSNTVSHCPEEDSTDGFEDDGTVHHGVPLPPIILEILSRKGWGYER